MSHFLYLAILAACLVAPVALELLLRARVFVRWRRLAATLVPVVLIFGGWDALAVHTGQWTYARRWIIGPALPGGLPIEEVLFFVVIPICAVATLEAVRRVRPGWTIGDES